MEAIAQTDVTLSLYEMCFEGLGFLNDIIGDSDSVGRPGHVCVVRVIDFGIAGAMLLRDWNPAVIPSKGDFIKVLSGKSHFAGAVQRRVIAQRWVSIFVEPEQWSAKSAAEVLSRLQWLQEQGWTVSWVGGGILSEASDELRSLNELLGSAGLSLFFESMEQVGFGPTPEKLEVPSAYAGFSWGTPPPTIRQLKYANDLRIPLRDGLTMQNVRQLISDRARN